MFTIGRYQFNDPVALSGIDLIDRAAVYAILCLQNGEYHVIYIGQTEQVGTRLSSHERAACWRRNCSGTLYVAILWTPTSTYTLDERLAIEQELIEEYDDPPCNRT